jgi:hypothetical protein
MQQRHVEALQNIINDMECPRDFQCKERDFKFDCSVRDVGLESHVVCLDTNPIECSHGCPFRNSFGRSFFCSCPVRVYVAKNVGY